MYARMMVIDDGRCNAPCSQVDLFIKYMFEGTPGTINEINFFPIGGRYAFTIFLDYGWSQDANVWHTYSWRQILPYDFQGIDTCQVRITLEGSFWQVIEGLNKYIVSHYGDFTFTDTLIVPIEKL